MSRLLALVVAIVLLLSPSFVFAEDPLEPGAPTEERPAGAVAAASARVLFSEDFQTNAAGWITTSDAAIKRSVGDNAYHISIYKPGQMAWGVVPTGKFSDFVLQVDATMEAGPDTGAFGVAIRAPDNSNFYIFNIFGNNEYRLDRVKDNTYATTTKNETLPARAAKPAGQTNTLRITAKGNKLEFVVNGVPVATKTDDDYTTGSIYLFASTPADLAGVETSFSKLTIWEAGAVAPGPEPAPDTLAVPRGRSLFSDNFADNSNGWGITQTQNSRLWLAGGIYHISLSKPNNFTWSHLPGQYGDFVMDVSSEVLAGAPNAESGVLFRLQDDNNFYRFALSNAGSYVFEKKQGGAWTTLIPWTASPAISTSQGRFVITVVAKGNSFTFYNKDTKLTSFNDDSFATGKAAISAGTFEQPVTVELGFSSVKVWEVAAPTPAPDRQAQRPQFSDDFADNSANWSTTSDQVFQRFIRNNAYHVVVNKAGYMAWSLIPTTSVGDFVLQLDMAATGPDGVASGGIIFRSQDNKNYYSFNLNNSGFFILTMVKNDKEIDLTPTVDTSTAIKKGAATNTIRLEAKGANFDFFINGTKVASVADDSFAIGKLAVFAVNPAGSRSAEATFSKVRVWGSNP